MCDVPERIWIDAWGGNWSPRSDGTQQCGYVRADLHRSLALDVVAAGGQAADAYAAQLKAEAMAEKLAEALKAAMEWNGVDDAGVPAVWSDKAEAVLAAYEATP